MQSLHNNSCILCYNGLEWTHAAVQLAAQSNEAQAAAKRLFISTLALSFVNAAFGSSACLLDLARQLLTTFSTGTPVIESDPGCALARLQADRQSCANVRLLAALAEGNLTLLRYEALFSRVF